MMWHRLPQIIHAHCLFRKSAILEHIADRFRLTILTVASVAKTVDESRKTIDLMVIIELLTFHALGERGYG